MKYLILAAVAVNIAVAAVAIHTHHPLSLIASVISTVFGYNYLARRAQAARTSRKG